MIERRTVDTEEIGQILIEKFAPLDLKPASDDPTKVGAFLARATRLLLHGQYPEGAEVVNGATMTAKVARTRIAVGWVQATEVDPGNPCDLTFLAVLPTPIGLESLGKDRYNFDVLDLIDAIGAEAGWGLGGLGDLGPQGSHEKAAENVARATKEVLFRDGGSDPGSPSLVPPGQAEALAEAADGMLVEERDRLTWESVLPPDEYWG